MTWHQLNLFDTSPPAFPEVSLIISWPCLLGNKAADMPESLRKERWERWLVLCRESEEPEMADYWTDASECQGCRHLDGCWCNDMELPCTINPILTFRSGMIGMACMGGGYSPISPK